MIDIPLISFEPTPLLKFPPEVQWALDFLQLEGAEALTLYHPSFGDNKWPQFSVVKLVLPPSWRPSLTIVYTKDYAQSMQLDTESKDDWLTVLVKAPATTEPVLEYIIRRLLVITHPPLADLPISWELPAIEYLLQIVEEDHPAASPADA